MSQSQRFTTSGGYDTLDLSDDTHNQRIDLRPGHFSDVYGETHNLVVADDAVIEAVIAGAGDDTIHGTDSPNRLMGRAGDDTQTGGGGSDRFAFYANKGHDTILDFTDNEDKIDLRPIAAIESMEPALWGFGLLAIGLLFQLSASL